MKTYEFDAAVIKKAKVPVFKDGEGKRLPSVRTIVNAACPKPGVVAWANALGLQGVNSALYSAELVRNARLMRMAIMDYLSGGLSSKAEDYSLDSLRAMTVLQRWEKESGNTLIPEKVDFPLINSVWRYGGQIDFIGRVEKSEGLHFVLFKITDKMRKEHIWEAAGYMRLLGGMADYAHRSTAHILRIAPDGSSVEDYWLSQDELERGYRVFDLCLKLYWELKGDE